MGFELAEGVRQSSASCLSSRLPLDPVLVAISELLPKIQDSQSRAGAPSTKVFNVLKETSLIDILPPAPQILPRRFQVCPTFCPPFRLCEERAETRNALTRGNALTILVVISIGHMAYIPAVGRYLRSGFDEYRDMERYDRQAIWSEAGAGEREVGTGWEGVEDDRGGLMHECGVRIDYRTRFTHRVPVRPLLIKASV